MNNWKFGKKEKRTTEGYERHKIQHCAYRQQAKARVFIRYGCSCNACGHADQDVLQVDHVNGCGRGEHGKRSSASFYNEALRAPWGKFQLLCANCNWKKRMKDAMHNQFYRKELLQ